MSDPWILAGYLTLYASLHSLLAARRVKSSVERCCPGLHRWYRLTYSVFSTVALIPLVPLMYDSPVWYRVVGPAAWIMRAIQIAGVAGFLYAIRAIDLAVFIGLRAPKPESPGEGPLITDGPYAICRHPQYFFAALSLVAQPVVTGANAVFTAWTVLYFWIGSWIEERRLLEDFGDRYRDYRARVPHFLPFPRK